MIDFSSYKCSHSREDMFDLLLKQPTYDDFINAAKTYINMTKFPEYALTEVLRAHKEFLKR